MIRKMFVAAAFATVLATPALAAETSVRTFVRDGVTYSYTTTEKNGVTVLQGNSNFSDFRFEVRGNKVTGVANGEPVRFNVSDTDALNIEQASR